MNHLPESELILNRNGSVYHLNLLPENIADTIITVGDPERVAQVSRHFDSIEFKTRKREFVTHTGSYNHKRISVISSGIGTDNVEILMNELDALANVDLKTRKIKEEGKKLNIIRIGTSGAIQREISIGSYVASVGAIGLDSLMFFYRLPQSDSDHEISSELQKFTGIGFKPYHVQGSVSLLERFGFDMVQGNTLTCPGFYVPQGRELRISAIIPDLLQKMSLFNKEAFNLTNLEMETSGYYALGKIFNHETLSLNAILSNRIDSTFAKNPKKIMEGLIELTLNRL